MVLQRQDVLGPQSLADLCSLASLRIPEIEERHSLLSVYVTHVSDVLPKETTNLSPNDVSKPLTVSAL